MHLEKHTLITPAKMSLLSPDFELVIITIPLKFANGTVAEAISDGIAAAWKCTCGNLLIGRSYNTATEACCTRCPGCNVTYKVKRNTAHSNLEVIQTGPA